MPAVTLPSRSEILKALETLAIGSAGGLLFLWLELPGGLISGAMIAVAGAGIAGRPLGLPQPIAHIILMTLGLSLGSMVSPVMIKNLSAYPVTIALLAAATFCATFGSSFYLQKIHGWDRTSALLAGSPGALSQVIMLATERNADVAGIAVVQIMRVIILTAAVPMLLAATGVMGHGPLPSRGPSATPLALAELAAVAVAAALLLRWLNFPASWMFGAMLGSSVMHGAGLDRRRRAAMGLSDRVDRDRHPDRNPLREDQSAHDCQPHRRGVRLVRGGDCDFRGVRRRHCARHACQILRHRGGVRAGRDGCNAGAGADPACRSGIRRRASSVALHLRLDCDPRDRAPVWQGAGRSGRLGCAPDAAQRAALAKRCAAEPGP
jgi:membrane AbrB-like protein